MTNHNSNFENDNFDFPEPAPSSPASSLTTSLELVKSVVLSRPFLLALVAFLSYRLWLAPSASKNGPAMVSVDRTSVVPERLSVRKSQRQVQHGPSVPPVTMAKK